MILKLSNTSIISILDTDPKQFLKLTKSFTFPINVRWIELSHAYHTNYNTGTQWDKYATTSRFPAQDLLNPNDALKDYSSPEKCETYKQLMNVSLAKSTWQKYSSALNAFSCFEADNRKVSVWPLPLHVCRAFVIWCYQARKLSSATIKTYLAGLKCVHNLRGFPCDYITNDFVINRLVKGCERIALNIPSRNTRRVVTFPLLTNIGTRIAKSNWDPLTKQVFWAAATTAFFGSLRLGEILASTESNHSPLSDLTWADVKASSDDSILLRIKQPKSGEKAEYVDLFKFTGYNCCPVLALQNLQRKQVEAGVYDPSLPVFRFADSSNLTMHRFNKTLSTLLVDICVPGESSISCHSFRAGIPSTLSLFPDLASSDLIKGWGRWASDCYQRYTRLKLTQKTNIFEKISSALRSVHPAHGL
jgi:hypothetical protein